MVLINWPLTPGAMARAVVTMAEGKSAALRDLAISSRYSQDLATGTGTDQYCIAAPLDEAKKPKTNAGHHAKLGELIGKAVRQATLEALRWQNGLEPSYTRGVVHALRRFGFEEDQFFVEMETRLDADDFLLLKKNLKPVLYEPQVSAAAYAFAAVWDRVRFGTISNRLAALKDLCKHGLAIDLAAQSGDVEKTRYETSMLVGRDTTVMDGAACRRAAMESLSESTVDGFVSPIFWYAVLGLPGIVLFKVISTMDSMVGFKTPRYFYFGWCGARLDDVFEDFREKAFGVPTLGVVPFLPHLNIADEDAVVLDQVDRVGRAQIDIVVIHLPGTKATMSDFAWLQKQGLDRAILAARKAGSQVVGICGGYQMLGRRLVDALGVEGASSTVMDGLDLLSVETHFAPEKQTHQVCLERTDGTVLKGYEIHVGDTKLDEGVEAFGVITKRSGQSVQILDGAASGDKKVWGTYVHGLFENDDFRQQWLMQLGWCHSGSVDNRLPDYDRLADAVEATIDGDLLAQILNLDTV